MKVLIFCQQSRSKSRFIFFLPLFIVPLPLCTSTPTMYKYRCAKSLQSCLTLCNLLDCSPPGSSVHGILQARILKWVLIPFSRESSQPRDQIHVSYVSLHWQAGSLPLLPLGRSKCKYSLHQILTFFCTFPKCILQL